MGLSRLLHSDMAGETVEQATDREQEEAYFCRERMKCTTEEETILERQHFWKVIDGFRYYRMHVQERVNRAEHQFRSLPEHHHQLPLPRVLPNLARIRRSVDHNQDVLHAIMLDCVHMFENMQYGEEVERESVPTTYTKNYQSMLKYLYDCVFFVARKPDHLNANGLQVVYENRLEALPRRESCGNLT
ncbi:carnosine N-methyltransferase-like [Salvelinus namaycush]|uniref:Carnosine N-methyltransferase-like n=1 Tax=Salvelinus namaycush TaxID=8040 RepID=A0A8U0R6U9_SALNM|nr:carnosine N-methyltransferase-like [Salvelinus namaycush]